MPIVNFQVGYKKQNLSFAKVSSIIVFVSQAVVRERLFLGLIYLVFEQTYSVRYLLYNKII